MNWSPHQILWQQNVTTKPLPWYAEQKLQSGAYAAFAGLHLEADGSWDAFAVGDSCIFQIREESLLVKFPLEFAEQFDSRPFLLSSNPAQNSKLFDNIQRTNGNWKVGDIFYLMTDAIACFYLRLWEAEGANTSNLSRLFDNLSDPENFRAFVELHRQTFGKDGGAILRNDDVTVIRCELFGASKQGV